MIENYINTVETIKLHLYYNGAPSSADELVDVEAEDFDTGEIVALSSPAAVSVPGPPSYEYYEVSLAGAELTYYRKIKVTWTYVLQGVTLQKIEIISTVQPYFFADDLWGHNPDLAPEGPTPKTIDEIKSIESVIRGIINVYCRQQFQNFGRVTRTYIGSGSNDLELDDRIFKLYSVDGRDINLFKRENDESVSNNTVTWNKDIPWQVSRTIENPGVFMDYKAEITPGLFSIRKLFVSGNRYDVDADFGWEYVPLEVKQAAVILANEYLCEDDIYHQKNIMVVRSADYRMEFGGDHHATTGNVYADQLLSNYVNTGVSVI
jgi:hypothetical protein